MDIVTDVLTRNLSVAIRDPEPGEEDGDYEVILCQLFELNNQGRPKRARKPTSLGHFLTRQEAELVMQGVHAGLLAMSEIMEAIIESKSIEVPPTRPLN